MTNRVKSITFLCIIYLIAFGAFSTAGAESEMNDTPYFSGMPNYYIYEGEDKEFDAWSFFTGKDCTNVEGRKFYRAYAPKEGAKLASELQIARNYANAIKAKGGTILFEGPVDNACAQNTGYQMVVGKFVKGKDELWAEIVPWGEGSNYSIMVVVKEAMRQDVSASALFESLNRDGHVALYINFDTGKSTIRAESKTVITQIVEMMKANPGLTISVEGHTDNVGNPKTNKTLSDDRAKAVVAAIVAQGVDAKRLSAIGHGQDRPIADNKTEEGRAKNRRVELVKK